MSHTVTHDLGYRLDIRGVCLLFCMSFLASVSKKDHGDFLRAVRCRLADEFVVIPFLMAFVLTVVALLLGVGPDVRTAIIMIFIAGCLRPRTGNC